MIREPEDVRELSTMGGNNSRQEESQGQRHYWKYARGHCSELREHRRERRVEDTTGVCVVGGWIIKGPVDFIRP